MIPESPRFLYLMGKREEGYFTLLDMYDKAGLQAAEKGYSRAEF